MPIMEAIDTIHSFGIEVVSGIIMGLDSDTPDTPERILQFVELSKIPLLTINLLQALPRTPLYRRLEAEGRLVDRAGPRIERRVQGALRPDDRDVAPYVHCRLHAAGASTTASHITSSTSSRNRITPPNSKQRVNPRNIRSALRIMANLLVRVGIMSDYRDVFWRMARQTLAKGDIEAMIHIGMVSHHLITFAREAAAGRQGASFYNQDVRNPMVTRSDAALGLTPLAPKRCVQLGFR